MKSTLILPVFATVLLFTTTVAARNLAAYPSAYGNAQAIGAATPVERAPHPPAVTRHGRSRSADRAGSGRVSPHAGHR
jgi:hypothetical protein